VHETFAPRIYAHAAQPRLRPVFQWPRAMPFARHVNRTASGTCPQRTPKEKGPTSAVSGIAYVARRQTGPFLLDQRAPIAGLLGGDCWAGPRQRLGPARSYEPQGHRLVTQDGAGAYSRGAPHFHAFSFEALQDICSRRSRLGTCKALRIVTIP